MNARLVATLVIVGLTLATFMAGVLSAKHDDLAPAFWQAFAAGWGLGVLTVLVLWDSNR